MARSSNSAHGGTTADLAQDLRSRWRAHVRHLPLAEGTWRYSRRIEPADGTQGWKIHVSATVLTASEVFARCLPILRARNIAFKAPAELDLLAQLNSGAGGFSQVGKFLTAYAPSAAVARAVVRELHSATRGLTGPVIPFDLRYRSDSLVHYRYGAFVNAAADSVSVLYDPDGRAYRDRRAPRCALPPWVTDCIRGRQPKPAAAPRGPIGRDYLIYKGIAQRPKGGVYEAIDVSVSPSRHVIIKQGRRHGDTDWDGLDGAARVQREAGVLRRLRAAGIPVPAVLREFKRGEHAYVVMEKLPGRPLLPLRREHPPNPSAALAVRVLEKLGALLKGLHALGYVWRDCKPAHIMCSRRGWHLLDFEGACRQEEVNVLPWGSRDYLPPLYLGRYSRQPGTLEDNYALGVIAFQFLAGEFPPRSARTRAKIYARAECPLPLRHRIESLLRPGC